MLLLLLLPPLPPLLAASVSVGVVLRERTLRKLHYVTLVVSRSSELHGPAAALRFGVKSTGQRRGKCVAAR